MATGRTQEYGGMYKHKITHPEHDLRLREGLPKYTCCGCKEIGENYGYKCVSCENFILHDMCALPSHEKDHPLDNNVKLRFSHKTKMPHRCDVCDEVIGGFLYKSPKRLFIRFRAHPACISLPEIYRFSKHNNYEMRLQKQKGKFNCSHCKQERRGWRYRCENTTCQVEVEVRCVMTEFYGEVKPCNTRKRDTVLNVGKLAFPIVVSAAISGLSAVAGA